MTTRNAIAACAVFSAALAYGCSNTPTAPSVWSASDVRTQLVTANLSHANAGARGRLTRWRVPIDVNTNNIARAIEALDHVEQWSGGVIRFRRVAGTPVNGLIFVEGGAEDVERGCVNISNDPLTNRTLFAPQWDASSALTGNYTINLGSVQCSDTTKGRYDSAYAEHILAHALGVFDHFDGFDGPEGLVDVHAFSVLYNLYANAVGTTAQDLVIWPTTLR
jgi:hypothetical protein